MRKAKIIIIRVNQGESLWSEVQQALQIIPSTRLVLLVNQQSASSPQTTIEVSQDDEYEDCTGWQLMNTICQINYVSPRVCDANQC